MPLMFSLEGDHATQRSHTYMVMNNIRIPLEIPLDDKPVNQGHFFQDSLQDSKTSLPCSNYIYVVVVHVGEY